MQAHRIQISIGKIFDTEGGGQSEKRGDKSPEDNGQKRGAQRASGKQSWDGGRRADVSW